MGIATMKHASTRLLSCLAVGVSMLACLTSTGAHAVTFSVVYTFQGGLDGAGPTGDLLFRNGNIYGLTSNGGPCRRKVTCGTAFELTPTGNKALLYSFGAITHGWFPSSGLIEGPGFELYGETDYGGIEAAQNTCGNIRCGTVFVLYGNGKVRVLYDFTGQADGYNPSGGLVRDSEGNLYGVTGYGGGTSCFGGLGCGQVFKISRRHGVGVSCLRRRKRWRVTRRASHPR